jgi:hypothetical protein
LLHESAVVYAGQWIGESLVLEVANAHHVEGGLQCDKSRKPDEAGSEKENAGHDQIGQDKVLIPENEKVTQVADHEQGDQAGHRVPALSGSTRRKLPGKFSDDHQRADQDNDANQHQAD